MRKTVVVCLLLILALLCLSACGDTPPELGRYVCVEALDGSLSLEAPESALLLDRGGLARLELDGESGSMRWRLDGEALQLTVNGRELSGTLQNGVLRLDTGSGLTLVYVREEQAEAYVSSLQSEQERLRARQTEWGGDWYGFWRVEDAEGQLTEAWYDCCLRVRTLADGRFHCLFWDEDSSAEKPLGTFFLRPGDDGQAETTEGRFWFLDLGAKPIVFTLEDGCLRAAGRHEADGEDFSFLLVLRRWGEKWPKQAQTPYYYDDWYLPLIRQGEAMPDRMIVNK